MKTSTTNTVKNQISSNINSDICVTTGKTHLKFKFEGNNPVIDIEVGETSVQCTKAGAACAEEMAQKEHERAMEMATFTAQGLMALYQFAKGEIPEILQLIREEEEKRNEWEIKHGKAVNRQYHRDIVSNLKRSMDMERKENARLRKEIEKLRNKE
jgi:hypothetical protein